jgi:hypothetical protein
MRWIWRLLLEVCVMFLTSSNDGLPGTKGYSYASEASL